MNDMGFFKTPEEMYDHAAKRFKKDGVCTGLKPKTAKANIITELQEKLINGQKQALKKPKPQKKKDGNSKRESSSPSANFNSKHLVYLKRTVCKRQFSLFY